MQRFEFNSKRKKKIYIINSESLESLFNFMLFKLFYKQNIFFFNFQFDIEISFF
jgi:hypothetical protein